MTTNTTSRRSSAHTREAILTALAATPGPITVNELAEIAGLGKSTLAKHLPALEKEGLAVRTPGGRDGRRRLPDQWAAPTSSEGSEPTEEDQTASPEVNADATSAPEHTAEAVAGADSDHGQDSSVRTQEPAPTTSEVDTVTADTDTCSESGDGEVSPNTASGGNGTTPPTTASPAPGGVPAQPTPAARVRAQRVGDQESGINPVSGSTRLAPGELKLMVRAIIDADPGEEFTATAISHILQGRSIGAIQNNLARLAKDGHAVQTSDRPRRYQSAKHAG